MEESLSEEDVELAPPSTDVDDDSVAELSLENEHVLDPASDDESGTPSSEDDELAVLEEVALELLDELDVESALLLPLVEQSATHPVLSLEPGKCVVDVESDEAETSSASSLPPHAAPTKPIVHTTRRTWTAYRDRYCQRHARSRAGPRTRSGATPGWSP